MKTYCVNKGCPFKSCKKHLSHCAVVTGTVSVSGYDGVCREYISWLVDNAEKKNNKKKVKR